MDTPTNPQPQVEPKKDKTIVRFAASARLPDSTSAELVYRPDERRTYFLVSRDGGVSESSRIELPNGTVLRPFSPENNLIVHRAILLPSSAAEYQTEVLLRAVVRGFIHRYVDLPPDFEEIAAAYVLLSWRYDDFPDLPYLRVLGDYGSGKSRFLTTMGSIAYRPIFASGASSVSPLFRILDEVGGTLVLDEGDFRFSDEKAEIVKILNNGNARGFPVLRTESTPQGEFNPRAFNVFGPKILSTRKHFDDAALESRCITIELTKGRIRPDIPMNLPPRFEEEALIIRNQLLMYRLREAGQPVATDDPVLRTLEPRIAQVFSSLLASVGSERERSTILSIARASSTDLVALRSESVEASVLEALVTLRTSLTGSIPVKLIARELLERDTGASLSPRAIGAVLRRLGLTPRKRHGNYVLPVEDLAPIPELLIRYGIHAEPVDEVDVGDVVEEADEAPL
jgi:hypothetical protein